MGWSTSVVSPPDGNLGEYLGSLEKLLDRHQDGRYLPAHGPQIDDPPAHVRAFVAHRRERSEQILQLLAKQPATIAELVAQLYADVRKQLWLAAAASVYAHLLNLHDLGLVEPDDGPLLQRASRMRLSLYSPGSARLMYPASGSADLTSCLHWSETAPQKLRQPVATGRFHGSIFGGTAPVPAV